MPLDLRFRDRRSRVQATFEFAWVRPLLVSTLGVKQLGLLDGKRIPLPAGHLSRRLAGGEQPRGQAFVELALILPLLLFMALGIFDFARAFTTAITIESAAREAADFGGLYPWHWDASDPSSITTTAEEMETRACSAASNLTDYAGSNPDDGAPVTCTNPAVAYQLINNTSYANCLDVPRDEVPCRVEVTVTYDFNVIVPLRLQFGDTELGLPSQLTISRESTFAISNFELDEGLAP